MDGIILLSEVVGYRSSAAGGVEGWVGWLLHWLSDFVGNHAGYVNGELIEMVDTEQVSAPEWIDQL